MKAILEFNLPEENKEHIAAVSGQKLAMILYEINYTIRRRYLKYAELSKEQYEIAEKIFDDIQEEINIDLDEIS